jgi:Flp pilus assembly protein TadD
MGGSVGKSRSFCLLFALVPDLLSLLRHHGTESGRLAGIADWATYMMLGSLLLPQKSYAEAVQTFRQALKLQPGNPYVMNNLGYTLLELDSNLDEALNLTQRAVKAAPANAFFRDSLGWAYFKTGNLAEAERELLQAAQGNPKSAVPLEHLGDVYQKLKKSAEALSYWKAALALATDEDTRVRIQAKITAQ